MPPFLTKYLIIGIVSLLAIGAAYLKGRSDVNELREADRAAQEAALLKVRAEILIKERKWASLLKDTENEAQAKVRAADARANDLAGRLRRYYASIGSVSPSTAATAGSPGTGPVRSNPDEADALVREHLAACEIDGAWLNYWIDRYRQLQDAQ